MADILVVGEIEERDLTATTAELTAAGSRLAQRASGGVALALLSDDASAAIPAAKRLAVSRVDVLEHPSLRGGGSGGFDAPVAALEALCRQVEPAAVLFGKTDFGANVGPRLAFRLGVPIAQDCIDVTLDEGTGRVAVTRPAYGGNAMAVLKFPEKDPQIVTIRAGVFEPADAVGEIPEVVSMDLSSALGEERVRLIETVKEERRGVRLEDAEVVVSGGRGLGGPEPFEQLRALAEELNGAVGASRAACDAGWIDHGHQIGLTGKSISPRVYLTFGISGASQHMAGCSGAKHIVAVNKDADANIFKEARFGVVGDWEKVLSGLMSTVKDLSG